MASGIFEYQCKGPGVLSKEVKNLWSEIFLESDKLILKSKKNMYVPPESSL